MADVTNRSRRWTLASILTACCIAICLVVTALVARNSAKIWSPPRIALYGGVPGLIALIGILVLLFRRSAASLFLACLGAAAAAMLLAEIVLARDEAAEQLAKSAPKPAMADGVYPQFCLVNPLDPPFRIGDRQVLPLGGIANVKLAAEPPHFSDERGFNNPAGLWSHAPIDILAVGDSFTYGADVPYGAGFVDWIRKRVPLTVNVGCSGNGPYSELGSLVEYGPELKPKVVLWVFYEGNDLKDVRFEARSKMLTSYLAPDFRQGLSAEQPAIDRMLREYYEARLAKNATQTAPQVRRSRGLSWRSIVTLSTLRTRLGLRHAVQKLPLAKLEQVLARAKAETAAWQGKLVFVYLPAKSRYVSVLGVADAAAYAEKVRDVVARNGIPIIDVASQLDRKKNPRALYEVHFSEEGYAVTAGIILDGLARLDLLPRP